MIGVALIFGVVNAILKPLIKIVGCLFYIITLGLIGLVVNALLFMLVGWLSSKLGLPFVVSGFWAAFWGAIVVAVVGALLHFVIPDTADRRVRRATPRGATRRPRTSTRSATSS